MTTQTNITNFATSSESSQSSAPTVHATSSSKSRGTRVQDGFITISGARNFTWSSISVAKQEVFEDVVDRGIKVSGLARKLGISDKGTAVKSLVAELFENDERKDQIMEALQSKQGRKERVALESVSNAEVKILQEGLVITPKMVEELEKLEVETKEEEEHAKKTIKKLSNTFPNAFQKDREWTERNFKSRGLMRSLLFQYLDVCEKVLDSATDSSACEKDEEDNVDLRAFCCCGSAKHIIYKELGEEVKLLLACTNFVGNEDKGHDTLLPVTMPLRQILASGHDVIGHKTRKSLVAVIGSKIENKLPVTKSLFPGCIKWSETSQTLTLLVEGIDARDITTVAFRGLRKIGIKMARKEKEEEQPSPIANHTRSNKG